MTRMLSFDNVELYYDHVYALKGVSIHLDEGETVALIGASQPRTREELARVPGVGAHTLATLGDDLLAVVARAVSEPAQS